MFSKIGSWLTEPSSHVIDENERRRARLLSAMTLPFLIVTPIGIIVTTFDAERVIISILLVSSIINYLVSRTRYFNMGGIFYVSVMFLLPLVNLYLIGHYDPLSLLALLAWFNLPTVLGSVWLKLQVIVKIWLFNMVLAITAPLFIREITYDNYMVPILHLAIIGSIVLLGATLRNRDEKQLVFNAEELAHANKSKSVFLANMSHELRTPLHGILGFAQLGEQVNTKETPDKVHKYFSQIHTSGNRLLRLLNDLLDLNKLEAGKMDMSYEEEDMEVIVKVAIELEEAHLRTKGLQVEYDIAPDLPLVECDSQRIGQVFVNLLSNAIKFSPISGTLLVAVRQGGNVSKGRIGSKSVIVSLADDGKGVRNDELETIFEKFSQSSSNSFTTGSTGLGLAICREIVDLHCGRIWAENRPSGGAVFSFELPVSQLYDKSSGLVQK